MNSHLQKLRAEIDADPETKRQLAEIERALRPGCLKLSAWLERIFPPESPTSKRRGGKKLAHSPEFIDAVCAILDAQRGNEYFLPDFKRAMKAADPEFFRMMADAAQYVRDMPQGRSTFAKHVIAARWIAADMMGKSGPLPSWKIIRERIAKQLGQGAYGETSRDWGRARKAAGLNDISD